MNRGVGWAVAEVLLVERAAVQVATVAAFFEMVPLELVAETVLVRFLDEAVERAGSLGFVLYLMLEMERSWQRCRPGSVAWLSETVAVVQTVPADGAHSLVHSLLSLGGE